MDERGKPDFNSLGGEAEPDADTRESAHNMRQWYISMRWAGFTENEACKIIGTTIAEAGKGQS